MFQKRVILGKKTFHVYLLREGEKSDGNEAMMADRRIATTPLFDVAGFVL